MRSKGARLWLRPERAAGGRAERAVWIIRDGGVDKSTGCGASERAEAERQLATHIAAEYAPERRERHLASILVADVINIYLTDVAPGHAAPAKTVERCLRLAEFFGDKTLGDVTGALCRAYTNSRQGRGRTNKGSGGGARRDLQDLAAAINHHAKEGFHREIVRVVLPPKGEARQRWLTRDEAARLLRVCRSTRESKTASRRPGSRWPISADFCFWGFIPARGLARSCAHRGRKGRGLHGSTRRAGFSIATQTARQRPPSGSRLFDWRLGSWAICAVGNAWTRPKRRDRPSWSNSAARPY